MLGGLLMLVALGVLIAVASAWATNKLHLTSGGCTCGG